MKRLLILAALLAAVVSCADKGPTWSEEFDSDTIDALVWTKVPRGASHWDKHMSDRDELFAIEEGCLVLKAIVNPGVPGDDVPLLTGGVWTKGKKDFGYGKLEIRAKIECAGGAWPAIWMMPSTEGNDSDADPYWDDYQFRNYGEIDICETLNYDEISYQTVHNSLNLKEEPENRLHQPKSMTGPINRSDFNVYCVEHYPDSIVLSINGARTLCYKKMSEDAQGNPLPERAQWTFDRPFYLIVDMQVGSPWPGEPVLEDLPISMYVDWIRFYEFNDMK